jgi:hypothetical protein
MTATLTQPMARVMQVCHSSFVPFVLEGPEPVHPVSIFNMEEIKEVAVLRSVCSTNFDQCVLEREAKEPTRLPHYRVNFVWLLAGRR